MCQFIILHVRHYKIKHCQQYWIIVSPFEKKHQFKPRTMCADAGKIILSFIHPAKYFN